MKKVFILGLMCLFVSLSLQAREKTLEEKIAEDLKTSEIFRKKAGVFLEDIGKDSVVKEGEKKNNYCKDVIYPPTPESFVKYTFKAFQKQNWNEVYCYSSSEYLDKLKLIVKKIEASRSFYYDEFSSYPCKIKSSKQTDMLWEVKEFTLEKMGTIKIDYMGDWKIIGLELNK